MKAKEIIGNCPRDQVEDHIARGIKIEISLPDSDLLGCPKKAKKQILVGSSTDDEDDTEVGCMQTSP